MTRRTSNVNKDALEAMVDSGGVDGVLDALAQICWEKAEHISSNWQDEGLAKLWTRVGDRVETLANSNTVRTLP